MLIQDPLFWGLALLGLLIVGVSKGGFGGGLGVVGVPFLAAAIPVNQAAATMLPSWCGSHLGVEGTYYHVHYNKQCKWEETIGSMEQRRQQAAYEYVPSIYIYMYMYTAVYIHICR